MHTVLRAQRFGFAGGIAAYGNGSLMIGRQGLQLQLAGAGGVDFFQAYGGRCPAWVVADKAAFGARFYAPQRFFL